MKYKLNIFLATLMFVAWLTSTGCATTNTPGRVLATTTQTVDAAMQGWWTYEALGQATAQEVAEVRKAYSHYQSAMALAETSYIVYAKTGDKTNWQSAADVLRASQSQLLLLVEQFKSN